MTLITTNPAIAELNDQFRRGGPCNPVPGKMVITAGIDACGWIFLTQVLEAVRAFDGFTEDNDPYGEHDYGKVVVADRAVLWKIDYYDTDYTYGSPDPADVSKTRRVLTLMFPEER